MTTLTGTLTVARPPHEAFQLFTPVGERQWAAGWDPHFPVGDGDGDDSLPGTVFQTRAHGQTATWLVMDRTPGSRIRYARVIPAHNAATVTVLIAPSGDDSSEVTVTYDLVALSEEGRRQLQTLAPGYPDFLKSWETAIAAL